jgi:hypothetical protein
MAGMCLRCFKTNVEIHTCTPMTMERAKEHVEKMLRENRFTGKQFTTESPMTAQVLHFLLHTMGETVQRQNESLQEHSGPLRQSQE